MAYTTIPLYKTPCPGIKKFTILVDLFLVIINKFFVCLIHALEKTEDFLEKYINFKLITPNLSLLAGSNNKKDIQSMCNISSDLYEILTKLPYRSIISLRTNYVVEICNSSQAQCLDIVVVVVVFVVVVVVVYITPQHNCRKMIH